MFQLRPAVRALLISLYLLQAGVLIPLHSHQYSTRAAVDDGASLCGSCPCPDPDHHHPGDDDEGVVCPVCTHTGRLAVLDLAPTLSDPPAAVACTVESAASAPSSHFHPHPIPRGPPLLPRS